VETVNELPRCCQAAAHRECLVPVAGTRDDVEVFLRRDKLRKSIQDNRMIVGQHKRIGIAGDVTAQPRDRAGPATLAARTAV